MKSDLTMALARRFPVRPVRSAALLALMMMMFGVETASAQDGGRVGLVMGYPQSVGVIWQVADRLAVRPEIAFSWTSAETTTITLGTGTSCGCSVPPAGPNDSVRVGVGASALLYFGQWDGLRLYAGPRFLYSTTDNGVPTEFPAVSSTYLTAGLFGAQYSLGRRFAVFGETGLHYSRTNTSVALPAGRHESRMHHLSTEGSAGVIFFF